MSTEAIMSKKTIGIVLVVLGVVLVLISLGADLIGIGSGGFGYKQIIGVIIGLIAALVGMWLAMSKPIQK
jgi:hypothetical protein